MPAITFCTRESKRLMPLDILRGFALLGYLLVGTQCFTGGLAVLG